MPGGRLAALKHCGWLPFRSRFWSRLVHTAAANPSAAAGKAASRVEEGLLALSLRQLRDVALLCGRNSTGTKAVLRAELQAAVAEKDTATAKPRQGTARILSIDMGVRNLAFCLLRVGSGPGGAVPELVAWERLSLVGDEKESAASADPPAPRSGSSFSPPAMAAMAVRLLCERLLPLEPSHVLIERQRFRSGSAAAVLEWTVRVNSLEAMLHGILAYVQQTGNSSSSSGGGSSSLRGVVKNIHAVSPRRVAQFLLRGGLDWSLPQPISSAALASSRSAKERDIKDVKEMFVAQALRQATAGLGGVTQALTYDHDIHRMIDRYLLRWDAKQRRFNPSKAKPEKSDKTKKSRKSDKTDTPVVLKDGKLALAPLSKIDDLADCLTQGLVWLEWERNISLLRESGAVSLLAQGWPTRD